MKERPFSEICLRVRGWFFRRSPALARLLPLAAFLAAPLLSRAAQHFIDYSTGFDANSGLSINAT
jgi:hypothetical protein